MPRPMTEVLGSRSGLARQIVSGTLVGHIRYVTGVAEMLRGVQARAYNKVFEEFAG
jgi:hypothetical protein